MPVVPFASIGGSIGGGIGVWTGVGIPKGRGSAALIILCLLGLGLESTKPFRNVFGGPDDWHVYVLILVV